MESRKRKRTDGRRIWSTSLQAGGVGVGVDQGRPFEAVLLVLARSGRRRMSTKPPALWFTGERNGKPRDLDGHDCHRRDPPIGTLRQSPCSGTHPPRTHGHAPTTKGADHGAAHVLLGCQKCLSGSCRCRSGWHLDVPRVGGHGRTDRALESR